MRRGDLITERVRLTMNEGSPPSALGCSSAERLTVVKAEQQIQSHRVGVQVFPLLQSTANKLSLRQVPRQTCFDRERGRVRWRHAKSF